jgi:hypothetical protein
MNDSEILAIYMAQSENVRHLKQVINASRKDINLDIRKGNDFQVKAKTKIMALLYSAWSEAQFLQIAYTENGFSSTEIKTLIQAKGESITTGWNKMIKLAFQKVGDPNLDLVLKSRLDKLLKLIKAQIEKPSILRNKIAHGQWVNALNGSLNKINVDLTTQLGELDSVQIWRQIEMHQHLGNIVRDLVQSPSHGFGRDYLQHITNLESYAALTQNWSLQDKRNALLRKPIKVTG